MWQQTIPLSLDISNPQNTSIVGWFAAGPIDDDATTESGNQSILKIEVIGAS